MIKKIGVGLGGLVAFLLAAAFMIPFVVDVDQYRPQLTEAVNQQINGKFEVGKLSLSLWGQIRVEVAGVKLKDSRGQDVLGVKDAYFHLPFFSLFSGAPILTFKMNQPEIRVIKNRSGQLNLLTLLKAPSGDSKKSLVTASPSTSSTSAPMSSAKDSTQSVRLPGIVTRARLGVELTSAEVHYVDEVSGVQSQVKDLNLILKDVSLSHPTELELWADLDTRVGNIFWLKGPARLVGKAQPDLKDGKIDHMALSARLDMDAVKMSVPGIFEKASGLPTNIELSLSLSPQEVRIDKFLTKFFNAEILSTGLITNLSPTPVVKLTMKSNDIQFAPWVELVPLLKPYELGGASHFEASIQGPSQSLNYQAKIFVEGLTAKAPQLKAQPKWDGEVQIVTDRIENLLLTMKAPGNDLKIKGTLISFSQPKIDLHVSSSGLDLDQLMDFPKASPKAKKPDAANKAGLTPSSSSDSSPGWAPSVSKPDLDALLAPLRENKLLSSLVAALVVELKSVKASNVNVSDVSCKLSFKDLTAGIDHCGFKLFSGNIKSDGKVRMRPKTPTYEFHTQVSGLQIKEAVESQMALFKNTLMGRASFSMSANGSSFNPEPATQNLKATGNLKVEQGAFVSIDIMKMVAESLNKTIEKVAEKVPAVKGKTVGSLPNGGSKYDLISSDFSISDGKFSAPNFSGKAVPNQGFDIKGTVSVGLKDNSLNAFWDVIDTYDLTKMRDFSVEQNGVKVEHVLMEGSSPVHFPMHINCTTVAPCYSYTEVPEYLMGVAVKNIGRALEGRAKDEVRKQAEALIKKAPPQIQEQLQEKLKGFFH